MNINLSGTGGWYGKDFMVCLTQYNIKPWFYPMASVYELMAEWSGKVDDFRIEGLSIHERLLYCEMFLVDEIAPRLYTESLGLFSGFWQSSWKSSDIPTEYVDETQLNAILDNADFYNTFLDEISSLRILSQIDVSAAKARRTLRRQIYIGAVTCLETYLSDAFINTVLSKDEYIRAFFSSFKDFKSQKLGVNELFTYVDQYKEIAKRAMMDVIYHNLPKVSHMYKETLGISFSDFSGIQSDIATRHDLVHRNGKTKEGNEIVVDKSMVDQVILIYCPPPP